MNERWVCKRCFTSNDADADACVVCGLARGSEVPAGEAPYAAAAAQPKRTWLSRLAQFWWIPLLLVVAIGGALFAAGRDEGGQIVDAGDLQVADLRVGDCFDLKDPSEEEVDDVEAKPCSEAHEFEMYYVTELPSGDYPTQTEFEGHVESDCLPAFEEYVGRAYFESRLDIFWFTPTQGGWDAGDRVLQCALFDPINDELTESMRDSGT